ncbi:helix-turn-helix domain-containing protein [Oceanibium sediminis]|uniref:helix-turn-helix domain-containing protein n=1 Tax=Oceanibium sediminis TaxID=2026339 RepID=UPI000DD2B790|nr:AraC family transcriptional regulator [Oceanibium sediminis]
MNDAKSLQFELKMTNGLDDGAVHMRLGSVDMGWQSTPDTTGSGVSWSLSHFHTRGPDSVEVRSTRDPDFVFTQVPLKGGFEGELGCGLPIDDAMVGLIRPRNSDAFFRFDARENELFGALAPLEVVERWFGDDVPHGIRPLLNGAGRETIHRPRALPGYLRQTLLSALASTSPLRPRLIAATAQQILGYQLESLCSEVPTSVSPLASSLARDAHAMLLSCPEDPPSAPEIAAQFGLSARRLEQAYREEFGCSFHANTQQVRLDAICHALREGMAIKAVAHRFGYSSVSNFSSAFRRHMGLPPRTWLEHQASSRLRPRTMSRNENGGPRRGRRHSR